MNSISQKEYLKKYLSSGKRSKDKKKVKKPSASGVKIIDDDLDHPSIDLCEEDLLITNEDAPQIVAIVDERPPSMRIDGPTMDKMWKPIGSLEQGEASSEKRSFNKFTIIGNSLTQQNVLRTKLGQGKSKTKKATKAEEKHKSDDGMLGNSANSKEISKDELDVSPPRRKDVRKGSDWDNSPLRKTESKKEYASDSSPPRKRPSNRNYDSDSSPPRKANDSCSSPPRKRASTRNYDSDNSPPRRNTSRKTNDSDSSPPRKRASNRNDSANSSPRRNTSRKANVSDSSPPRKRPSNRNDSDNSSPRRNTSRKANVSDSSPPRKRASEKKSHHHHASKENNSDSTMESQNNFKKMKTTLDGKTAGLQSAKELHKESLKFKLREDELFDKMDAEVSGRNAVTVIRDRKTGHTRDLEKEAEENREQKEKEGKIREKYTRWGKGVKQVEDDFKKAEDVVYEMSKPLARYADDEDLEKYLKSQEHAGDPMLLYMRSKKKKVAVEQGIAEKPIYTNEFMPNRYGIRPGYRWDGVDRSNGFEKRLFEIQNERSARMEEAFRWSTEDM